MNNEDMHQSMQDQMQFINQEQIRQTNDELNRNQMEMHNQLNNQSYMTQPMPHNMSSSNNQINQKAQEKEAIKKVGATASRAGLDAVTGGKYENLRNKPIIGGLAKKAENRMGNTLSKLPGSKQLGGLAKKADDAGLVDGANKAMDVLGGKKPSSTNSKNLKDSVPDALKNKNRNNNFRGRSVGDDNKSEKNDEDNQDSNDNNQDENENEETTTNNTQETRGRKLLKKLLPIIIMSIPMLLIIVFVIDALMPIITAYSSFMGLFHHNTDKASSYTITGASGSEMSKEEEAYYDAIRGSSDGSVKGIVSEYQEKYGVTIDWYLLNALIKYRYNAEGGNMFSSDGNDDISDEELQDRLDELNKKEETEGETSESTETTAEENSSIDYGEASKKITAFASLMVVKENGTYTTDIEKEGVVYNNILNSKTFSDYYKNLLKENSDDSKKRLLDEIYDYAENARELMKLEEDTTNGGVVGDTSIVYLQSCTKPKQYTFKNVGNFKVYDMELVNEGTSYPLYLSLRDYVKGVIYRENFRTDDKYREATKAQAIMALSFLLRDSHSGFDMKNGEMYFPTETCRQATCDPNYGCTSVGGVASYSGTDRGGGTVHRALNEKEQAYLDSILDEVFGLVIVKKGVTASTFAGSSDIASFNYCNTLGGCSSCHAGSCVGQTESNSDSASGMDYKAIFAKYFTSLDYDIINITEGLYFTSGGNYNGGVGLNEAFHFHQGNYKGANSFCEGGTISARGCSVTSTAIAVSVLTGQKHDPLEISNKLKSTGNCNGNRVTYPASAAKLYGLSSYTVSKKNQSDVNRMLQDLGNGKTAVVARLDSNSGRYDTQSGHYIALVGVKTEENITKVLVWDPAGNKGGKQRDNYWADFNGDILKYTNDPSFVVLSRR